MMIYTDLKSELRRLRKRQAARKIFLMDGGPGSGNFGHEGIPGKQGGSMPGNGAKFESKEEAVQYIKDHAEEIREKYSDEYTGQNIGIRIQEESFTEGETLDSSYRWIDGEPTDEELPGTCALNLEDARHARDYFGDHVAIIGGRFEEWGEDLGEVIISDARVLEVLS